MIDGLFRVRFARYVSFILSLIIVASVLSYGAVRLGHYYAFEDRILTFNSVFFSVGFFIFFSCCFGFWASCLLGLITSLMVLVDHHLGTHYNYLFATLGKQLILVLRSTNDVESFAYLNIISAKEYFIFAVIIIFWGGLYWLSRDRSMGYLQGRKRVISFLIAAGFFMPSYYGKTSRPLLDYLVELRKNGEVLKKHSDFQFNAKDADPGAKGRTYILLVGETHRHDHIHAFGYPRNTSPNLDKAKSFSGFYHFEDMISGYTLTQHALPVILTRKPISYKNNLFYEKSILSAFKEAGYKTYFITYLNANHPFEDGVALISGEADVFINHRSISNTTEDEGIFAALDKIYQENEKKKLIVIKMIGVHFEFEKRYPAEFDVFRPSYQSVKADHSIENASILINTYDNAMLYSDKIVGELIERVKSATDPNMLMFVSDHGTTLYDDGKSEDRGLAKGNYHVPFFVYGNKPYWKSVPSGFSKNLKCNKSNPLTQEYVFDTFLRLARIDYSEYRKNMDLASHCTSKEDTRKVWTFDGRYIPYSSIEH